MASPSSFARVSLALGLGFGLGLLAPERAAAQPAAEPGQEQPGQEQQQQDSRQVIPPGREDAARELLAEVQATTPVGLRWQGPRIEVDRIKWWLLRGEEARAMLVLVPRELGEAEDPRSESFAIQVAWAPKLDPEPRERQLLDAAVAAIQSRDRGQFYLVRLELFEADDRVLDPPYVAKPAADPSATRRRWALQLTGVATLGLFALVVTLRRRSSTERSADSGAATR